MNVIVCRSSIIILYQWPYLLSAQGIATAAVVSCSPMSREYTLEISRESHHGFSRYRRETNSAFQHRLPLLSARSYSHRLAMADADDNRTSSRRSSGYTLQVSPHSVE